MKLTDQDRMPFGKHKGTPMEAVPARYLLWMWDEFLHSKPTAPSSPGTQVHDYIKENFAMLETEASDYITTHKP